MSAAQNESETPAFRQAVSAAVEAARNEAGNAEALASKLSSLGFGGDQGAPYSISAISNWVQGRAMPPADVFLAVTFIGDVSVDAIVRPDPARSESNNELRAELARLRSEMVNLYEQTGVPYKPSASSD